MFTDETYKQIKLFFSLTSKHTSLPIKYNSRTHRFEEISTLAKIWYLIMLVLVGQRGLYHLCWIIYSLFHGFPKISDAILEIFYFVGIEMGFFFSAVAYIQRKPLAELLNQLLQVNGTFKDHFLADEARGGERHRLSGIKYSDGCSLFMKLLTPGGFLAPFPFAFMFLLQSDKRIYLYRWLPGDKTVWHILGYFLLEWFQYMWFVPAIFFLWYVGLLYGNSCGFWLGQIGASNPRNSWTRYPLYHSRSSIKIYRILHILTIELNAALRDIVLPIVIVFVITLHTISIFVCVKFHTQLPIPLLVAFSSVAGFCFVFEVITYPMLARVYVRSVDYVGLYDGVGNKEWRLTKRALPYLGVSVGQCYVIQRQTALTLMSLVVSTSSNLLVSTG